MQGLGVLQFGPVTSNESPDSSTIRRFQSLEARDPKARVSRLSINKKPASKKRSRPWPTKHMPRAPVTARRDGDPRNWTAEQKQAFHAWALRLKDYPGQG